MEMEMHAMNVLHIFLYYRHSPLSTQHIPMHVENCLYLMISVYVLLNKMIISHFGDAFEIWLSFRNEMHTLMDGQANAHEKEVHMAISLFCQLLNLIVSLVSFIS